jgi:hypothetical protein
MTRSTLASLTTRVDRIARIVEILKAIAEAQTDRELAGLLEWLREEGV